MDFTQREACCDNLAWLAEHGIHAVVGTTGFTDQDMDRIRAEFTRSNCVIAPNFAIGAVLMMHFAAHRRAVLRVGRGDRAPPRRQGRRTVGNGDADRAAHGGGQRGLVAGPDHGTRSCPGPAAVRGPAGIHVHSVRLRGLVAHQEVLLGTTGQTLTIRHDSIDRTSFMPGVVLAVKQVADTPGVTVGLDALLGL